MQGQARNGADDEALLSTFAEYRRTGDRAIRNELVERYISLAEALARRFTRRGEPYDDLRQVALLGLVKAVERFDPERGLLFPSFAAPTIVGEIKRHFRDKGWTVRVPRWMQELHLRIDSVVSGLGQELGRSPTTAEIAKEAGVTEEEVIEAMEAGHLYRPASLDAPRASTRTSDASERVGSVDVGMGTVEDRATLRALIAHLPEREQRILYLRFFEEMTQSEIAGEVGISQMHVSRLLARSLETLSQAAVAHGE